MKKSILMILIVLIAFITTSCDFLSDTGNMAQVTIPLLSDSGSRAVGGTPAGTTITGFTVSVFGPGMQKIVKKVSPGARYVNMYIPAGPDRYFTLEIHFTINDAIAFPYEHIRSFKGRAIADLRPGRYTKLRFTMVAGATQLLVPDYNLDRVWVVDTFADFSKPYYNNFGEDTLAPSDLDVFSNGNILVTFTGSSRILYSNRVSNTNTIFYAYSSAMRSLAVDKANEIVYSNISVAGAASTYGYPLRFTDFSAPAGSVAALTNTFIDSETGITYFIKSIAGLHVDPWTGLLYICGKIENTLTPASPGIQAVLKYDPTGTGSVLDFTISSGLFRTLNDIIVKDDGVYVLNETDPASADIPVLLKFDHNLNYISGYGRISLSGIDIEPSVDPGMFYHPKRFFAHENEGLFIIDDSLDWNKVVYINTDFNSSTWDTYPRDTLSSGPFAFFD